MTEAGAILGVIFALLVTFIVIACAAVLYFAPIIVMVMRKSHSNLVIFTNIFAGWTMIGWLVAFAFAFAAPPKKPAGNPEVKL